VAPPTTSTQRPDCPPTIREVCGGVVPPCGPAEATTDWAPAGQLPLVTVTLLFTTLPRSPLFTLVLLLLAQLPVTVRLPMFSPPHQFAVDQVPTLLNTLPVAV
jgi:hypothetical protein